MADLKYLRSRAYAERAAATGSSSKIVQLRHLEFAEAYEFLIREMDARRGAM
jgi:hypothetical protein